MTVYDHIGENKIRNLLIMAFYPVLLLISTGVMFYFMMSHTYTLIHKDWHRMMAKFGMPIFQELAAQPFEYWINEGFFYVLIGVVLFCSIMLIISFFFGDALIMHAYAPLSHPANKKQNSELLSVVGNMARTAGLPAPEVYISPDYRANVYCLGRNPSRAIMVITEGTLKCLSKSELEAVVAQQMIHIGNRDTLTYTTGIVFVYGIVIIGSLLPFARLKVGRGLYSFFIGIILMIYGIVISPLVQIILSKQKEFTADAACVLLTRNPGALIKAIKKMRRQGTYLKEFKGEPLMSGMCMMPAYQREPWDFVTSFFAWFDPHPDTYERLLVLASLENKKPEDREYEI